MTRQPVNPLPRCSLVWRWDHFNGTPSAFDPPPDIATSANTFDRQQTRTPVHIMGVQDRSVSSCESDQANRLFALKDWAISFMFHKVWFVGISP